jgi:isopentenyl-diphosphate delta-isomerase
MAQHREAWQVFAPNGEPIAGQSILPAESRKTSKVIVGAAHIWIWRRSKGEVEVLLQLRAKDKPTWPDYLDISAAGHIDAGESPIEAAKRECLEEIGLEIDGNRLDYIFGYRNFDNGIKWVYLYEQSEEAEFIFNDGEVESLDWIPLSRLENNAQDPEAHNLVPHPREYYALLIKALQRV